MDENLNDEPIISNQEEEEVLETSNEEDNDEIATELAKAKELANNYKIRAEKAEKAAKTAKSEPTIKESPKPAGEIASKDMYALMEAKVPQDDIDEVIDFAKFKGISVAEALKSSYIKSTLVEKAEQRNVAGAANVNGSKRSSGKVPDDVLLSNATKGVMPDTDADLERLLRIRKGL